MTIELSPLCRALVARFYFVRYFRWSKKFQGVAIIAALLLCDKGMR